MDESTQTADRWYVLATSSRIDDRTRVLKDGETFAVFDPYGDIMCVGTGEHGIYHQGTRFVSRLELRVNGQRPMLLNSSVRQDNILLGVDFTTPDLYGPDRTTILKGTVHVFRSTLLWNAACHSCLRIMNYGDEPVALQISLDFGADYADIFEVRGFRRPRRGTDLEPAILDDSVVLAYRGLDGATRRTTLRFVPRPTALARDRATYALSLSPKCCSEIYLVASCDAGEMVSEPIPYSAALAAARTAVREARERSTSVLTANDQFNEWLSRSAADLVMLATDGSKGPYPYAGVPWYSTPFGRDGILTALAYLWADPAMARGVLAFLASTQANEVNPERDAEPGKILHETRKGELAALGEIPFDRYYGSVDSTPLFVALAGAYFRRTGDIGFVRELWPNLERALDWIERYGDPDGDGLVEYQRRSASGLVHQGWKDSEDAVFHRDGRPAEGPIALAEVQGYAYRARLAGAEMAAALGRESRAEALRNRAAQLREAFEHSFWCEELGTYAMALDGAKQPCRIRSSNAGQVLWSGIARPERAQRVAATLLDPASFSGWGVRTIAEGERRYNPMSYHNGSIWPHDNAFIAMGLSRYGMREKALTLLTALFDATLFMDLHRLPELFCGFPRRPHEGPTLYPIACSPQAWASASVFYLLQACLGLSFSATASRVRFRHPILPAWLPWVKILNLRVGGAVVDLALERHEHDVGVNVLRKDGEVEVVAVL